MQLYIKKLKKSVTRKQLTAHFKEYKPDEQQTKVIQGNRPKNIGFITIHDEEKAMEAIRNLNGSDLLGSKIFVEESNFSKKERKKNQQRKQNKTTHKNAFPYQFIKRKCTEKSEPEAFHDELKDECYDIAFDITWTTMTTTALNPCIDPSVSESYPAESPKGEYGGYNRRWLMTEDGRLSISPFTVKSAIANGFANLMGSCYRIADRIEASETSQRTYHGDDGTIPKGYEACSDVKRLCPRCKLFGMVGNNHWLESKKGLMALKGRFKSSALLSDIPLVQQESSKYIPFFESPKKNNLRKVELIEYKSKENRNKTVCKQMLLPFLAEPKSSNKLADGYFDTNQERKGIKQYVIVPHRFDNLKALDDFIRILDGKREIKFKNGRQNFKESHRLRSYALICDSRICFKGTVGIENASQDEIAAMFVLLHTDLGYHAFQLGLGKALGMGAVISGIDRVWIRKRDDYIWECHTVCDEIGKEKRERDQASALKPVMDNLGITKVVERFAIVSKAIREQMTLQENEISTYPKFGKNYWNSLQKVIEVDKLC